ncbi:hypothetical protein [Paenibacillus sp. R14(2021)]|uniref:hypothetical protein n=1 Tax=Paenibacillus sp. R14(2021) TaxID=2859228 RepID=UPI001C61166E|nr:hypothetical protein [Paenibacillus sp. R14(2021)]
MAQETDELQFLPLIRQKLTGIESLLDVGSGPCFMLENLPCKSILALEIHRPYLINRVTQAPHIIPINVDALYIGRLFVPGSVEAVSFIDSLEHFTKQDALLILKEAEQAAKKRVIVFTPRGYFPQHNIDHYGMNGEIYQTHRSGWEPEEFEAMSFQVTVMKGLHDNRNQAFTHAFGDRHEPVDALLAVKEL